MTKTFFGQLIAEIAKFGGDDKAHASQLATILLPHIDSYVNSKLLALKESIEALNKHDGGKYYYVKLSDVTVLIDGLVKEKK